MLLENGSTGSAVQEWQTFLISKGLLNGSADGIFGEETKAATIQFQQQNNLSADGIVGSSTLSVANTQGANIQLSSSGNTAFPPANTLNAVFDISHFNGTNLDFVAAKQSGMDAVFQKATQGSTYTDPTYSTHRTAAQAAGLLWGAYHFGDNSDPVTQATHFLSVARPGNNTLLVLDFEGNQSNTMSLSQAEQFVEEIHKQTGRYPGLYGGSLLKSDMSNTQSSILTNCWLWLAQYGSQAELPEGWNQWTFWQYTDGSLGPVHEAVAGVGVCDREIFNGDSAALATFWQTHSV